ncbi:MAG TPA: aspartate/glutamate racemase family protein [Spirochaetia bacterium]
MKRIAFMHSTTLVVDAVKKAATALAGEYELYHVVDEALLGMLTRDGGISSAIVNAMRRIALNCQDTGMEMMVCTCSSLSPVLDRIGDDVDIPLLKIDRLMFERAVAAHDSIGLVMTNPTTQKASAALFERVCADLGRHPRLVPLLCEGAFALISRGDSEGHDREVVEAVRRIAQEVDHVVLAQISMARIRDRLPPEVRGKTVSGLDSLVDTIRRGRAG